MLTIQQETNTIYSVPAAKNWTPELIAPILEVLEKPNWAPWLAAGYNSLLGRSQVFPEGQIVLLDQENNPLASISTNRIFWDGNIETLPTWDEVAGEPTTYEHTYQPDGNTIVLMSANVDPNFQGQGFGKVLINSIKQMAGQLSGIDHVIGSFRPTGYGQHKLELGIDALPFDEYCSAVNLAAAKEIDNQIDWEPWGGYGPPLDPWLRNLARNGMIPLAVDWQAMKIMLNQDEFNYYKSTHNPSGWLKLPDGTWLCGEVGKFYSQDNGDYLYQEANLWGQIII